jgi:putative flavoprotein involved in K+ transport
VREIRARHDVIVIGGGQARALGYHLDRPGRQFTILDAADAADAAAAAWRSRWDSLKLFTSARYDGLPGRPFPGDPGHYPGRDEVVEYLTDYARDFELPVELNRRVQAVDDAQHIADQVSRLAAPVPRPRFEPARS